MEKHDAQIMDDTALSMNVLAHSFGREWRCYVQAIPLSSTSAIPSSSTTALSPQPCLSDPHPTRRRPTSPSPFSTSLHMLPSTSMCMLKPTSPLLNQQSGALWISCHASADQWLRQASLARLSCLHSFQSLRFSPASRCWLVQIIPCCQTFCLHLQCGCIICNGKA